MHPLIEAIQAQRPLLLHSSTPSAVSLVAIARDASTLTLSPMGDPLSFVRVTRKGKVDLHNRPGPQTRFTATLLPDSRVQLHACTGAWLTVAAGQFTSTDKPHSLYVELQETVSECNTLPGVCTETADITSSLTKEQLAQFIQSGYIIIKQAVPVAKCHQALKAINQQLAAPETDPAKICVPQSIMADLFNTSEPLWSAVNALLGHGNVRPSRGGGQAALRFPGNRARPVGRNNYHIDGMGNNACGFSLLCGVALSDQSLPDHGNLHVFPGSHTSPELAHFYLEHIHDPQQAGRPDKPDVGEPQQVLLEMGDVVIAHQMLAHSVGHNHSPHVRYQLYFRVSHAKRGAQDNKTLAEQIVDDPWTEYQEGALLELLHSQVFQ